MNKDKPRKWLVEVTDEQLRLIADCLEDCSRFASGQCELWNTTNELPLDRQRDVRDTLRAHVTPLVSPYGGGSSWGWDGGGRHNPVGYHRRFIARTYALYREMRHRQTLADGIDNVYASPTLTCPDNGGLPIVRIKEEDQ